MKISLTNTHLFYKETGVLSFTEIVNNPKLLRQFMDIDIELYIFTPTTEHAVNQVFVFGGLMALVNSTETYYEK